MDRMEEYRALNAELDQIPPELAGSVSRARTRARRARLFRSLRTPAASVAAAVACFVLLVNLFPTFALACSGVPVIRELAAAVAFSPSLSAAVAHDYVQYIGKSQTVDGVTVNLEYAVVDRHQAVFFYSVEGGRFYTSPRITGADGEPVGGYSTSYATQEGGLEAMTLSFGAESSLPDRFSMELFFQPKPEEDQRAEPVAPENVTGEAEEEWVDPRNDPAALCITFEISLDPGRILEGKTVAVGRWMELDGQRILVDRLELFPTRTVLYLEEDSANSAWLRSLKFSFVDGNGNRYDNIDGVLSATGEVDSRSFLTYYFQSFYYDLPEGLALEVHKAGWLEKDAEHVTLDLNTGACGRLPDGVTVDAISRNGTTVAVTLLEPVAWESFGQIFDSYYRDPEGGEHCVRSWSYTQVYDEETNEKTGIRDTMFLEEYLWDTVELGLSYTGVSVYEEPVLVPLF